MAGWIWLLNIWDGERQAVMRVEQLKNGKVVALILQGDGTPQNPQVIVQARHEQALSDSELEELVNAVAWMLRFNEDLGEFHQLCKARGGHWYKLTTGQGRLLRSPTLFEDIIKTICTTNIQWGGTKRMVSELVKNFGAVFPLEPERRAFPLPETIAALNFGDFNTQVRLGYRAIYIHKLAEQVSSGELELSTFLDPLLSTLDLRKALLELKGIGPYAAATLLMLLGRYDELAVDTEFRAFVSRKYFPEVYPGDKTAQEIYAEWGRWKYLAYWFDNYGF